MVVFCQFNSCLSLRQDLCSWASGVKFLPDSALLWQEETSDILGLGLFLVFPPWVMVASFSLSPAVVCLPLYPRVAKVYCPFLSVLNFLFPWGEGLDGALCPLSTALLSSRPAPPALILSNEYLAEVSEDSLSGCKCPWCLWLPGILCSFTF